jgi:hypothetical protein
MRPLTLSAAMRQGEQVTPLELFFDLVFVLALTQCTALMAADPTWEGMAKGLLVLGVLMLFLWLGTEHRFAWANRNLLLFPPLCLLLLPGAWRIARGRAAGALFRWTAWLVALCAVLALFLNWLPVVPQRNLHWIVLLLPVHVALAHVLTRYAVPMRR